MSSIAPKPTVEGPQPPLGSAVRIQDMHLSPRRRKESLLPQITQLALQGHSGRSIGRTLGLSKRTVNHWLQKLRQEWIAKAAQSGAEMLRGSLGTPRRDLPRGDGGLRNSQTQPQRGSAALLARATAAVTASWRLKGCPAPPRAPPRAGPRGDPAARRWATTARTGKPCLGEAVAGVSDAGAFAGDDLR